MNTKLVDKVCRVFFIFAFVLGTISVSHQSAKAQELVPPPYIRVILPAHRILAYAWPLDSTVTLEIDDPTTGVGTDYTDTAVVSNGDSRGNFAAFTWPDIGVQPGFVVTMTGSGTTKMLIVSALKVTIFDYFDDTVSGTATPGTLVSVWTQGIGRWVTEVPSTGKWTVNFGVTGIPPDDTGTVQIHAQRVIVVDEYDSDGDVTTVNPDVPIPFISIRAQHVWYGGDQVQANEWPLGSTVTLEIDDPGTLKDPDYSNSALIGVNPDDHSQTFANIDLNNFIVQPGFIIRMSDGPTTKTTTVVSRLRFTGYDFVADTISGVATPGAQVDVWACPNSGDCVYRHPLAKGDGTWMANFKVSDGDGNPAFTLVYGTWVDSQEYDVDGNRTMFGLMAPSPTDYDWDGIPDVLDPCPADPLNTCNPAGSAAGVIGSNGGTVTTGNTEVALTVPAGAITDPTSFSITDVGSGYTVAVNQGTMQVVNSYSIQPHGTVFNPPATLTFRWDDVDNNGIVDGTTLLESNLVLIKDGTVITPACGVNPACDMTANTLTVQISSLSLFELAAPLDSDGDGLNDNVDACPYQNPHGFDADHDGCTDTAAGLRQLVAGAPASAIANNNRTSLLAKMDNAIASLNRSQKQAAIGQLQAFINEVQAQRGKKITSQTADLLIAYVNNVIAGIH